MDLPQAKVLLGHRFSDLLEWTSRDRFALAVVGEILGGGGAISRIAGRLRTGEGLVYRASAELIPGQWWPGEWRIFFESRGDSIVRATEAVLEELQRLQTVDVHPMELAVVQQTLEAHLRLDFDTAEEVSGYFAEDELIGRPHAYWRGYLEGVHAVTAEDVRRAAKTFLHSDFLTFLVVGRWEEISPGDGDGTTPLETLTGYTRIPLKTRDPLTMKVRAQD
jgi:zinc protease